MHTELELCGELILILQCSSFANGTIDHGSYPEPFKCDIKVRSVSAEALIRTICNEDQLPSSHIENISSYIE